MVDTVWQDVKYGLRTLRRSPGFTFVAASSLAVSIGVGTIIFGIVSFLLQGSPKPLRDAASLIEVYTNVRDQPFQTSSYPDYLDLRQRATTLEDLVASSPVLLALNPGSGTRTLVGEVVTGNYFTTLGIDVVAGRPLRIDDDRPGAARVAVVSHGFWQRELGASRSAVGTTVRIRGQVYTIVGVAPPGFVGTTPFPTEMWIPIVWVDDGSIMGATDFVPSPGRTPLERRGERWLWMKGRLKAGRTLEHARADLTAVMRQLEATYPDSNKERRFSALYTRNVRLHPIADPFLSPAAIGITLAILLLMLVACANVTGMQLARATGRLREVTIRLAIGASRRRLVRQLVTESLLLAAIGGASAVALAWLLLRSLPAADLALPIPIRFEEPQVGSAAIWYAVAASILSGIVSGLAPALRATRAAQRIGMRVDMPNVKLQRRRWTLRDGLVVLQTAIAVLLLVSAALLTRSLMNALRIDVGFDATNVTAVTTGTGVIGYDGDRAERFYAAALQQLRGLPEVENVALTWRTPLDLTFAQEPMLLPDRDPAGQTVLPTERTFVSAEYFDTLGVRLIAGRNFSSSDTLTSPRVAIVSETMARRYWNGNRDAIGKRFRVRTPDGPEVEIVGVSADYKVRTVGEPATPYIHYAASQRRADQSTILVRTRPGVPFPVDRVHRLLATLEPDVLFQASSMTAKVTTVLTPTSAAAGGMAIVGLLAMVFAAIGLYGVTAFTVAQRTHEFGVRLALGAQPRSVVGLVLRRGLGLAALGAALGALVATGAAAALSRALYNVSPADPLAWAGGLATALVISLLAHAMPARRAATVDPVRALRAE